MEMREKLAQLVGTGVRCTDIEAHWIDGAFKPFSRDYAPENGSVCSRGLEAQSILAFTMAQKASAESVVGLTLTAEQLVES